MEAARVARRAPDHLPSRAALAPPPRACLAFPSANHRYQEGPEVVTICKMHRNTGRVEEHSAGPAVVRPPRRQARRWSAMTGLLVGSLLAVGDPGTAASQAAPGDARESVTSERPEIPAVRAASPPVIDGRLDDPAWDDAPAIARFRQIVPEEGRPVSQPTTVRILYDDAALYVAADLRDDRPISTRLGRRDTTLPDSDWFGIALDSYLDRRTGFRLRVNPSGVRFDEVLSRGDETGGDSSWDPVWEVATAVTDSGWTVEMRIPFHQLRFRPAEVQTWGIQIEREIARRQERSVFAFSPRSERGGIAAFGHLTGLHGIRPGGRWEALPYLVGRAAFQESEPGNPFREGRDLGSGIGVDLTYRATANLTLNATINPDFGQVEADPAEVNLSVFETRLAERRPFFVEGSEIFRFGGRGAQFFYSRRIGRAPQRSSVAEAVHLDVPNAAAILGAAKLTGKTQNGWSIGVVEAVTGRETARFVDAAGSLEEAEVEPRANHFVARVRRELREGETTAGAMFTAANRDVSDARIRSSLHSAAYMGGLDFTHQWDRRSWFLQAWAAGTHVRGTPGALLGVQRASSRYFQRPDAVYLRLDSAATTLSGFIAGLEIEKQAGEHWQGDVGLLATSPGFEINDLGFGRLADRIEAFGGISYRDNEPGRLLRSWRVELDPELAWNFGGDFLGGGLGGAARAELLNYWMGRISVGQAFAGVDDRLTRGGPVSRSLAAREITASIATDPRRGLTGEAEARHGRDEAGGWWSSFAAGTAIRPSPSWSVSVTPGFSREVAAAQYLTTLADPLATETYGHRYVFASLDRRTVSLRTRMNVIFQPGLSLEMYAEPFLASGAYGTPMQLASPGEFRFLTYGTDLGTLERTDDDGYRVDPDAGGPAAPFTIRNRDFRTGSLRGNAVMRWEWRSGSTFYLVWQQERASFDPVGRFRFGTGFQDLWSETPANVFMLKMNYWLNG